MAKVSLMDLNNDVAANKYVSSIYGEGQFVKLEGGQCGVIRILSPDFEDGWTHWYNLGEMEIERVVAPVKQDGSADNKNDPISAIASWLYSLADRQEKKVDADAYKKMAGRYLAKYEAILVVALGTIDTQGRIQTANYEGCQVKKLRLSKKSFQSLMDLIILPMYSNINSGKDLCEFDIKISKGQDKYASMEFLPLGISKLTGIQKQQVDELKVSEDFVFDKSKLEKAVQAIYLMLYHKDVEVDPDIFINFDGLRSKIVDSEENAPDKDLDFPPKGESDGSSIPAVPIAVPPAPVSQLVPSAPTAIPPIPIAVPPSVSLTGAVSPFAEEAPE